MKNAIEVYHGTFGIQYEVCIIFIARFSDTKTNAYIIVCAAIFLTCILIKYITMSETC